MEWSIRKKLIVISLLFLAIPSIIIGLTGFYLQKETLNELGTIRLKNSVQIAIELIDAMNKQVEEGHLTLDEAQEEVKIHLLGKKNPDGTRPINSKVDLGENGYFTVFDQNGTEVAHPTLEGKNVIDVQDPKTGIKFMREVIQGVTQNSSSINYYYWNLPNSDTIAKKVAYSQLDPHWGWIVSAGSYLSDYNGNADKILYILLIILGISFLVGVWIILMFSNHIAKPITKIAEQTKQVAKGNLVIEPIVVHNKDEVGQLANDFTVMVQQMRDLVKQVRSNAEQVSSSAEELTVSSEQTGKAIEQVASNIQEVAVSNDKQYHSIKESSFAIQNMSSGVEQISNYAQSAASTADETTKRAVEGNQEIQSAISQMDSVNQTFMQLSDVVQRLGERSQEIEEIIEVISGIAAQTNLLALNAAIEAARAGEQGRGFAVVADEVRKLAEQSAHSSQKVSQLISFIQVETNNVVQLMSTAAKEVSSGINRVNLAGETFEQIEQSVKSVAEQIQEVSNAVQQMSSGTEILVQSVRLITDVSEKNTLYTQNVSAASEEQLASMQEVSSAVQYLAKMADDLNGEVEKFKL